MGFVNLFVFFCLISVRTFVSTNRIYVNRENLDFSTYLGAPHEVCNEISCITVKNLFFYHRQINITDSSIRQLNIICPPGILKVAYNDQAGKFRAASAQTNKARRSVDKRLLQDCERIETNPHYMNPTVSSLQKVKKNMRKNNQFNNNNRNDNFKK